jgi:hypothetical protein
MKPIRRLLEAMSAAVFGLPSQKFMHIGIAGLLLLAVSGLVFADGNDGTYTSGGKTTLMKAVFAVTTKEANFVVFTDKPDSVKLDAKKFGDRDYLADFRCDLGNHGARVITLIITKGWDFALSTFAADCRVAQHVPGQPQINIKALNGDRIAGEIQSADARSDMKVSLSFAQSLHGGIHDLTVEENKILDDAMPSPNDAPPPPPPPPPEPPPPPKRHS